MKLYSGMSVAVSLPPHPTEIEAFAAQELEKYLQKIFGSITFSANADTQFAIGGPGRNVQAKGLVSEIEYTRKVSQDEGFLVQIEGNTAVLAGNGTGQLYAVYDFLERELDCCFGAFPLPQVPAGEVIPTYQEKELPDIAYSKAADLPYRTAIVQFGEEAGEADLGLTVPFIDYLAKNRYNRILTWMHVYKKMVALGLPEELTKRGIRLTVGHHQTLTTFLPFEGNEEFPTPYGKTHPEFFRLQEDGARMTAVARTHYGQWYLCSRNEECIEEMAKNINTWLARNPLVDTVALWPNDGISPQCCCEKCAQYTKMENYLYFMNEVTKRLTGNHKVDVIAYRDLWSCPEGIKLNDQIVVDIATWTPKGLRPVGKRDGSALLDGHICESLHDFHNAGCRTVLYEYYMGNYGNRQAVMPAADEMQSIFRYFKTEGFQGSGTQIECFNLWNNIFNFYCFARTAFDTELSLNRNIADFTRLFGLGAGSVAEILRIYEQTLDGQVPINETGKFFAEHINADTIYALFEKAFVLAETPLYRNNLRLMRMAFHYTILLQTDTEDARKELGAMATRFDSFKVNNPGYGIAIDVEYRNDRLADDKWYQFEQ